MAVPGLVAEIAQGGRRRAQKRAVAGGLVERAADELLSSGGGADVHEAATVHRGVGQLFDSACPQHAARAVREIDCDDPALLCRSDVEDDQVAAHRRAAESLPRPRRGDRPFASGGERAHDEPVAARPRDAVDEPAGRDRELVCAGNHRLEDGLEVAPADDARRASPSATPRALRRPRRHGREAEPPEAPCDEPQRLPRAREPCSEGSNLPAGPRRRRRIPRTDPSR